MSAGAPPLRGEEARSRQLRAMQRRATGLLVIMAVTFVAVTLLGHGRGWSGYLQAALEASLVGGLADWFAVTALFRHPLGVPIPHTAVIPKRKDYFGLMLGEFVQQNFLSPDVVADRVRSAHFGARVAEWLSEPDNAEAVAENAGDVLVGLADMVRDEDIHQLLAEELRRAAESIPVAPLAGRLLRMLTAEGRHQELFESIVQSLSTFLADNHDAIYDRYQRETPWWLPEAVDIRIFDRMYEGVVKLLQEVQTDPHHELRAQFDQWVGSLSDRLQTSPELLTRGEALKQSLLEHAELRDWSSSIWTEAKATLRSQVADPQSNLRRRLAEAVCAAGQRLSTDPVLAGKLDEKLEAGTRYVTENFHEEIAGLVSGTVARWDADDTSHKLELLLGRDLQFIRINGTVVGGLAGLVIHVVALAIRYRAFAWLRGSSAAGGGPKRPRRKSRSANHRPRVCHHSVRCDRHTVPRTVIQPVITSSTKACQVPK
jgi:uncharacterized membrane-anchored protein YjiN (DUF445 family)